MAEKQASRTAVLVCQGRAVADGRLAVGRFGDPVAVRFLHDDERAAVERVRTGAAPQGMRPRMEYEMLNATAAVLATRTVVIDEAIGERHAPQLVVLGAGLDGRAWRLPDLDDVIVYEVDQPASQQDKRERAGDLPPVAKELRWVPVEFGRDELVPALAAAGHRADLPTTWIWEGVLPYLTAAQVDSTLVAMSACSAAGSRLIATYPVPSRLAAVGRLGMRVYSALSSQRDPLRNEPHISTWTVGEMAEIVTGHGWTVTADHALADVAERLAVPASRSRFVGDSRAVVADRG
ncbi:class I SAM-dependent methyltransferase [Nocardia sp. alder85J]|uniref:class I SAM-dependent methyltransferase n=1 Tax=Nocardia sp. alder85J TaxID=2862949 RepID=UPI001CD55F62|nr:class I SAM-dependent methyltransferase [Nocardia sp. alder85J]MCX4091291.1 class I SAM-dependent methyltransferase [Nocardia sp. alder85J]